MNGSRVKSPISRPRKSNPFARATSKTGGWTDPLAFFASNGLATRSAGLLALGRFPWTFLVRGLSNLEHAVSV